MHRVRRELKFNSNREINIATDSEEEELDFKTPTATPTGIRKIIKKDNSPAELFNFEEEDLDKTMAKEETKEEVLTKMSDAMKEMLRKKIEYDGSYPFNMFLDLLQEHVEVTGCTQKEMMKLLPLYLQGKAKKAYKEIKDKNKMDYKGLVTALAEKLVEGKSFMAMKQEVDELKQKDRESLEEYRERVDYVVNRVYTDKLGFNNQSREYIKAESYLRGLGNELSLETARLCKGKTENLEEVVEAAKTARYIIQQHERNKPEKGIFAVKAEQEDKKEEKEVNAVMDTDKRMDTSRCQQQEYRRNPRFSRPYSTNNRGRFTTNPRFNQPNNGRFNQPNGNRFNTAYRSNFNQPSGQRHEWRGDNRSWNNNNNRQQYNNNSFRGSTQRGRFGETPTTREDSRDTSRYDRGSSNRYFKRANPAYYINVIVILCIWLPIAAGIQICTNNDPIFVEMPTMRDCSNPISEKAHKVTVELFTKRAVSYSVKIKKCYGLHYVTCNDYISYINIMQEQVSSRQINMEEGECRVLEKSTNETELKTESKFYGRSCNSTEKKEVVLGEAIITNGATMLSGIGNMHGCEVHQGVCIKKEATYVWDKPSIQDDCEYESAGTFNAYINQPVDMEENKFLIIETLQATFVINEDYEKPMCLPTDVIMMENDAAFRIITETRNKRGTPPPEGELQDAEPESSELNGDYKKYTTKMTTTSTKKTTTKPNTTTRPTTTPTPKPTTRQTTKTPTTTARMTTVRQTTKAPVTTTSTTRKTTTPTTTTKKTTSTTTTKKNTWTTTIKPITQTSTIEYKPIETPDEFNPRGKRIDNGTDVHEDLHDAVPNIEESESTTTPEIETKHQDLSDQHNPEVLGRRYDELQEIRDEESHGKKSWVDDSINVKLQYLETQNLKEFNELFNKICVINNNNIKIIRGLTRINPTIAARIWLAREDIKAEFNGKVLAISECNQVEPDQILWERKLENKCYKETPVIIQTHIFFMPDGTQDLITKGTEVDCANVVENIHKNNNEWVTANGQTILVQQNKLEQLEKLKLIIMKAGSPYKAEKNDEQIQMLWKYLNRINNIKIETKKSKAEIDFEKIKTTLLQSSTKVHEILTAPTDAILSKIGQWIINPAKQILEVIGLILIIVIIVVIILYVKNITSPVQMVRHVYNRRRQQELEINNVEMEEREKWIDYRPPICNVGRSNEIPHIMMQVNGHKIKVLVDTGAAISYMDEQQAELLGIVIKKEPKTCRAANGSNINIIGRGKITIQFTTNERTIEANIYIAQKGHCPIEGLLIGSDILRKHGADINFNKNTITMEEDEFPIYAMQIDEKEDEEIKIVARENYLIRPGENLITGLLKGGK